MGLKSLYTKHGHNPNIFSFDPVAKCCRLGCCGVTLSVGRLKLWKKSEADHFF